MKFIAIGIVLLVLQLAAGQTVTVPNINLVAGQCGSYAVTQSTIAPSDTLVQYSYNASQGLTFGGASTGTFIAIIPQGSTSSSNFTVCSTNSGTAINSSTVNVSSTYPINGGTTSSSITLTALKNLVAPVGTLSIPRGGCSSVQTINISSVPTSSVTVALDALQSSGFYIKNFANTTTVNTYSPSSATTQSFQICSYYNNTTPLTLLPVLSGVSASEYRVNNGNGSTLTLSVVSGSGSAPNIGVNSVAIPVNSSSTEANIYFTSDLSGLVYYTVRAPDDPSSTSPSTPMNLSYILQVASVGQQVRVHNQSDFLSYLNTNNRDLRINRTAVTAGFNNHILIDEFVIPNSVYQIYTYFMSYDSLFNESTPNLTSYTSPNRDWPVYSGGILFNQSLTREQRGSLLYWLQTNISSPPYYLLNLRGESSPSSTNSAPNRPFYIYEGDSMEASNYQTIYLLSRDASASSPSTYVTNWLNLWSGGSLTSNVAAAISTAVGVNVVSGTSSGSSVTFNSYRAENGQTATVNQAYYQSGNISVSMTFSGGNGVAYTGIAPSGASVSTENLINCVDSTNATALLGCERIIFRSGESTTFNFTNVSSASGYQLFYAPSNAYTRRPIMTTSTPQNNLTGNNVILYSGNIIVPGAITLVAGSCVPVPVSLLTTPFTDITFNGVSNNAGVSVNQTFATTAGGVTTGVVGICATSAATGVATVNFTPSGTDVTRYVSNTTTVNVVPFYNITVPSGNVNIPRGGCSLDQVITITNVPVNDVSVNFSQIAGSGYYFRDLSTNSAVFDATGVTNRTYAICSYYNNTSPLVLSPTVIGTNAALYQINNGLGSTLNLNVVSAAAVPLVSIVATSPVNSTSTDMIVNITTDLEGYLYYTVRSPDDPYTPITPLSFQDVLTYVNSTDLGTEERIHNQSDFLTYLYSSNRDLRINGSRILAGNANSLLIDELNLPGLTYQICRYFQSPDLVINQTVGCTDMVIPNRTWPVYETAFQFNSTLSREQRNNLLKWLYTSISAPLLDVVNLRGETANTSGGSWPSRPYYVYNGSTNDSSNTQTLYVYTEDTTGVNSSYVNNLYSLFQGNTQALNSTALSSVSSAVGATATAASLIGYQPFMTQRNDTARTLTTSTSSYSNGNVTVANVTMTGGNGIVYFAVAPSGTSLSSENITNCVAADGSTLIACARSALRSGQNATLVLSNVSSNGSFQVYSTSTNAYLLRPILINSTNSATGQTVSLGGNFVTTNPSSVTVAPGACQNINVTIGTWPYTNVTINSASSNSNITTNPSSIVIVDGQPQTSQVQVCANSGSSTGTSTINWSFSGTNAGDYVSSSTGVNIVTAAGDISLPTSVTVPQGGCSGGFVVNSSGLATTDVYVQAVGNNTNFYFPNATDNTFLHFNQSSGISSYNTTICSYASSTGGVIPVTVGGVNSNVFTVNGGNQANITTSQSAAPTPSIYFQANPIKYNDGTNVTISVVSNREGFVYYALTEGVQNTSIWTLREIRNQYSSGNYYVWNQSAFNRYIYTNGREAWVNRTVVVAGKDNYVNHTGLQPATIYTICGYYSNADGSVVSSSANCSQFLTNNASWPIYRAVLNFSRSLTNVERNRLLCYLANNVQPMQNRYLTNIRSESCNTSNVNSTVANEWYNYTGQTSNINGTEIIYLLTQDNGTASTATTNFLNMFDPNTNNTVSSVSTAISSVTGVTLTSGKYDGVSSVGRMKISNRTMYFVKPILSGNTMTISNMTVRGGHGVVYLGVSPTSSSSRPTPEQLINCVNGNGTYGYTNCSRVVFGNGQVIPHFNSDHISHLQQHDDFSVQRVPCHHQRLPMQAHPRNPERHDCHGQLYELRTQITDNFLPRVGSTAGSIVIQHHY
jgi:hypothetical protein